MSEKKKVIVFTTGGTIAMKFDPKVNGLVPAVSGADLAAAVPGCALGMSGFYRVKVPKCRRWRQAHSQRQGLNREVPTEGSPRQTIDLTNRNGLRHTPSGKTASQVEAQKPHGGGGVKTEGT